MARRIYKAYFLRPRSSYRSGLHSDTLWGAVCWAIRALYDEDRLKGLISSYEPGAASDESPFYLSSAFPYVQSHYGGKKTLFLPRPLGQGSFYPPLSADSFEQAKGELRQRKAIDQKAWLEQSVFESEYCGGAPPATVASTPELDNRPMTHNTINRLTGSTLSLNGQGQLFHTEERRVHPGPGERDQVAGLYFLADGDTTLLEAALRFLEHYGIGGDRSVGKGRFDMEQGKVSWRTPDAADAQMVLSLYHPTKEELDTYDKAVPGPTLCYKTTVRQGWYGRLERAKPPRLYFTEGSVFPGTSAHLGQNVKLGTHPLGHEVTQYGCALTLPIKTR